MGSRRIQPEDVITSPDFLAYRTIRAALFAMSRPQPRNTGAAAPSAGTRMNEYFVPRDGIDREVISADICRYLGNDALVRPGHYEV